MTAVPPFPQQAESASVVTLPITESLSGLAHATRVAVQAGPDPLVVYGSILGDVWHPVALLKADELATLPFLNHLRIEPATATATLLASFPLR